MRSSSGPVPQTPAAQYLRQVALTSEKGRVSVQPENREERCIDTPLLLRRKMAG